jgi:geranylgeranyl pyrophosphate synthase
MGDFGYALGMGFQIQDDILDIMGESDTLGKAVGSDLSMHKQTILTIKLQDKFPDKNLFDLSIEKFRQLLQDSGVLKEVEQSYKAHFDQAYQKLDSLPDSTARELLIQLTKFIHHRQW